MVRGYSLRPSISASSGKNLRSGEFSLPTGSTQRPFTRVEPPDPFQHLALAAAAGEVGAALFHFFAPVFDDICLIAVEGPVGVVSIVGNRGLAGAPKRRITVPLAPGTLLGEMVSKPQVMQWLEADDAAVVDLCREVRLPPNQLTFISLFHEDHRIYLMMGHGRMARDSNEMRTIDVFVDAASQALHIARLRDEMLRMRDRIRRK
jgi:hypothetical protein